MATPQPVSTLDSGVFPPRAQFLGHPAGLFLLFMVEMWERFSYYGMRAILVLYLTSPLTGMEEPPKGKPPGFNPGPDWSDSAAATLYGWYTGLAYLTPVIGGIIADKLIGTHRSMLVGGLLIMLGHIALAASGLMEGAANSAAHMSVFIGGLAAIVIGTGHFKPSVSVMVGQLYPKGDPRRDGGFSIFYMGINLGAFLCAFVCGTLGERVGWHWGFGSAAVGMFLGLAMYVVGRPYFLQGIGEPHQELPFKDPRELGAVVPEEPAALGITEIERGRTPVVAQASRIHDTAGQDVSVALSPARRAKATMYGFTFLVVGAVLATAFGYLYHNGSLGTFVSAIQPWMVFTLAGLVFALAVWFVAIQRPGDKGPVATIFIFMMFNAFFWLAFEQAGSSMTLFANRYTDRHIAGPGSWEMPTSWFQSVNPAFIFLFAPVFAATWTALGRRRMNPSQPVKIALGLILLGLGFVVLVMGASQIQLAEVNKPETVTIKASIFFLLGAYFLHTMGELCLSPTGLSYVTKAAPVRFVSLLMGIWFVSSFIANLSGGLIAAQTEALEKEHIQLPWSIAPDTKAIQADFFLLFVLTSIGAGVLILVLTPLLKKLMRSPND